MCKEWLVVSGDSLVSKSEKPFPRYYSRKLAEKNTTLFLEHPFGFNFAIFFSKKLVCCHAVDRLIF